MVVNRKYSVEEGQFVSVMGPKRSEDPIDPGSIPGRSTVAVVQKKALWI